MVFLVILTIFTIIHTLFWGWAAGWYKSKLMDRFFYSGLFLITLWVLFISHIVNYIVNLCIT
jgi:hypothetical protein